MEELRAIELLLKVMLGEHKGRLPPNSIRKAKARARVLPSPKPEPTARPSTPPVNYISDNEDKDAAPQPRRSKQILSQRQPDEDNSLQRIVALAANETATVPPLAVDMRKLTRGYHSANLSLQLDEWAYKTYFVGAILDEKTGE